jgi:hypothetical protein
VKGLFAVVAHSAEHAHAGALGRVLCAVPLVHPPDRGHVLPDGRQRHVLRTLLQVDPHDLLRGRKRVDIPLIARRFEEAPLRLVDAAGRGAPVLVGELGDLLGILNRDPIGEVGRNAGGCAGGGIGRNGLLGVTCVRNMWAWRGTSENCPFRKGL